MARGKPLSAAHKAAISAGTDHVRLSRCGQEVGSRQKTEAVVDQETVAEELAENIRQNTQLRHRLGMTEGVGSGVVKDVQSEATHLYIDTADGQTFAIGVVEVKEDAG